jgi:DNA polymerase III epsilon subunit-like protein
MSYTNLTNIKNIVGCNVLFIHLETTGLIQNCKGNDFSPESEYPSYTNNEDYDSSRIVQIGFIFIENFQFQNVEVEEIENIIIKPNGFVIPNDSVKIHKITTDIANTDGKNLSDVFKTKITKIIKDTDYIVGYNIFSDVNVLLNELHRLKFHKNITKIKELITNEKVMCIGQLGRTAMLQKFGDTYFKKKYTITNQTNLYKHLFNDKLENVHNAQYDIYATIKILNEIVNKYDTNNVNPSEKTQLNNFAKKWLSEDENSLINYILSGKSYIQIAGLLGRTKESVQSKADSIAYKYYLDGVAKIDICSRLKISDIYLEQILNKNEDKQNIPIKLVNDTDSTSNTLLLIDKLNETDPTSNTLLLIDKLTALTDKHIAFYEKTGKHLFSDKLLDSLLAEIK